VDGRGVAVGGGGTGVGTGVGGLGVAVGGDGTGVGDGGSRVRCVGGGSFMGSAKASGPPARVATKSIVVSVPLDRTMRRSVGMGVIGCTWGRSR
jgi:hypothetical protein